MKASSLFVAGLAVAAMSIAPANAAPATAAGGCVGGCPTSFSSLLKNLEMESFCILAGGCWGGAVELDVILQPGVGFDAG